MRSLRSLVADAQDKVNMFSVKIHKSGGETLIACCDADILGKRLTDGELDIHVSEGFYGGDKVDEEGMIRFLGEATVANIIGERAVDAAVRRGIVEPSGVIEVCGLKHAQVFRV
jgi:uncharacterized protein